MDIVISNLLTESISNVREVVKLKICNYAYLRILSLTISLSQKVKIWISHCILKKWFDRGRVHFLAEKSFEKAELPEISVSFSGNMPEAQLWKVSAPANPANP